MSADTTPEALAALHARCFTAPPPWSARAFAEALAAPGALLIAGSDGFLLARVTPPPVAEAELLTLAVAPEARRRGIGRALCGAFAAEAAARGATAAFLEVDAGNDPARALYAACGWHQAGLRRGYYGPGRDAVILRRDLSDGTV